MPVLHYRVVAHDGGWAYTLNGAFSEPYPSREAAMAAAKTVADEQSIPDDTVTIEYQAEDGSWHTEVADGHDRPEADVV